MVVIIIYLAVFAGGFGVVLLKECLKEYRRQTRGLTLDEQFQRTMADLDRDVRENINTGVVRLRQECRTKAAQRRDATEVPGVVPINY
jgi:hypothetical protein